MNRVESELYLLLFALPILTIPVSYFRSFGTTMRHCLGVLSSLAILLFFTSTSGIRRLEEPITIYPQLIQFSPISAQSGLLFNFIYLLVYIAFGKRIFATSTGAWWVLIQVLVALALVSDNTLFFVLMMIGALFAHLHVSQLDVYQVSKKQDRFILVTFYTVVSVVLCLLFFGSLAYQRVYSFSSLYASLGQLPFGVRVLSSLLMMSLLGAFPFHSWIKPLFAAPSRYGLGVIARINIGFVVWSKLYPLVYPGDVLLDELLTYGCGANLLYASFLLFGERKLSQIIAALYLFHVPLLILAVKIGGVENTRDFTLDFANISVAVGGLLIILGMLRDRLGAENLDVASGLAISYPFLGIAFLLCMLSLVGFPGTLGFLCSELILHHLAEESWPVASAFIVTLALNGYSSFRIFGEAFYGDPAQSYRRILQPLARERFAIVLVLLFLIVSGIGPQFIR